MPDSSPKPDCTAMILLRTITRGSILRNVMPNKSKMPIPALDETDWIQSRRYLPRIANTITATIRMMNVAAMTMICRTFPFSAKRSISAVSSNAAQLSSSGRR